MERLTTIKTFSDGVNQRDNIELKSLDGETCRSCCYRNYCDICPIQEAINHLATYEDTGMMPEEIAVREETIKQAFREYIKRKNKALNDPACKKLKIIIASMMTEVEELYAQIFGISFDEAAAELHGGDDEND